MVIMEELPNCRNCYYVLFESVGKEECNIAGKYSSYPVNEEVLELIIENDLTGVCEYWQKRKSYELN